MMRLFYTLLLGLGASFAWRHPEDWWVDIVLSFPLVFRYRNRFDNLFINASLCVRVRKVKDIKYVETVNVSG